jgi:hypothetical protein
MTEYETIRQLFDTLYKNTVFPIVPSHLEYHYQIEEQEMKLPVEEPLHISDDKTYKFIEV